MNPSGVHVPVPKALLVLALLAGLVGCSAEGATTSPSSETVPQVMPDGSGPYVPSGAPPNDDSCVASWRPTGPIPAPGQPAGPTVDAIRAAGKLRAGVDQNTLNWGYYDPATEQLQGFDIDMVLRIAQAIFGDPDLESARQHVAFKVVPNVDRSKVVAEGTVDLVAQTMTATCARTTDPTDPVDFSTEYYTASQRVLVHDDSGIASEADLSGKRVCATKGSTSIARVAQIAGSVPVQANNQTDCLVMLQQGQVDAVSTDDTILNGFAVQDPNLRILDAKLRDEPYGIAIAQNHQDLTRLVNAVLERTRASGWADSYQLWVCAGQAGCTVPPPPPAVYRD
jgi:polar amino acid transport system substrate-binding protein